MRWTSALPLICMLMILTMPAARAGGVEITNSGDNLRTGWYPDEPSITPQLVAGGTFGQLWSAPVEGQVYAQPLLDDGTLLIATEQNDIYGLDPATGAAKWSRTLNGTPFNPGEYSCGDIAPVIGVTATPVIDPATNIAYLTHKGYISGSSGPSRWYMDAIDVLSGKEEPGFPVALEGSAQNAPGRSFEARAELQRPGLLLMEGVVYAAFGSDCDQPDWQGWIFGVSTTGTIKARWVADATGDGAGIWQSGAGLTSDGPGTILLSTGNGGAPSTPAPGSTPPSNLGESIVRLKVQSDGSLAATDFFAPFDAASLDEWDADFASGGVTGLPSEYFGTAETPHLAVAVGKDGYVYLLNRDHLGGIGQGPSGSDEVVQRIGPYGGVWSRPGVWPGEGGWVYIPTASGGTSAGGSSGNLRVYKYGLSGTGKPSLSLQGTSPDAFGFGSGAPVITSEGTTAGSALVWIVWSPNATGSGSQLRAYDPIPSGGAPVMRFSAPVGTASKFSMPGVGAGRLYVGTRDGHVLAFGSPVTPALTGPATAFPTTTIGESSKRTLVLTASEPLTLSSLESSSAQFKLGSPSPTLPAALLTGATVELPVTFTPTATGPQGATVTATASSGKKATFALSGTGQATGPKLEVVPPLVTFGGTEVGGHLSAGATFRNVGGSPLKIEKVNLPSAPFGASGAPEVGSTIAPGGSITVTVTFDPAAAGTFTGQIELQTSGGNDAVGLSGSAATPGVLQIEGESVEYGSVAVGASESKSFKLTNSGGTAVTITKSKPPTGGAFEASTSLAEGTTIEPGQTLTETVVFKPGTVGAQSGVWQINGDGSSGVHQVSFSGTGYIPTAPGALLVEGEALEYGEVAVGGSASKSFKLTNTGGTAVTIEASTPPSGAFEATSSLALGAIIQAGKTVTETVSFKPTAVGSKSGSWTIRGNDGSGSHQVKLSGSGYLPGALRFEGEALEYGEVTLGSSAVRSFKILNTGARPVTILTSQAPAGAFAASTSLAPGTVVEPGQTLTETVAFEPAAAGPQSAVWKIQGDDASGAHSVALTGTGFAPAALIQSPTIGPMIGVLPSSEQKPAVLAPRLVRHSLDAGRRGDVTLMLDCPYGLVRCKGTITLRTLDAVKGSAHDHHGSTVAIAEGPFSVRGGHTAHVRLHVSHRAALLLQRAGTLRARATILSRDAAGLLRTIRAVVTVKIAP